MPSPTENEPAAQAHQATAVPVPGGPIHTPTEAVDHPPSGNVAAKVEDKELPFNENDKDL